ncbi:uncharacterized protein [Littorina saxatilis]|uniref:uncharacterized protein n=1 Tax=Littorina saxatilis TaxID=31220 RepID=UPI0038B5456A
MVFQGIVLFLVLLTHDSVTSTKLNLAKMNSDIAGRVFNNNLVFVFSGLSDVSCARRCMTSSVCVTFTYSEESKMCRGHSQIMTPSSPGSDLPGTVGFLVVTDWVSKACSIFAECTVPNSGCYGQRCVCTHGYYYSKSNKNCVQTCSSENLQDEFVTYPNYDVANNDIYSDITGTVTVEQCQSMCSSNPRCLTITYVNRGCYLKNVTALTSPTTAGGAPGKNHYQRMCA